MLVGFNITNPWGVHTMTKGEGKGKLSTGKGCWRAMKFCACGDRSAGAGGARGGDDGSDGCRKTRCRDRSACASADGVLIINGTTRSLRISAAGIGVLRSYSLAKATLA